MRIAMVSMLLALAPTASGQVIAFESMDIPPGGWPLNPDWPYTEAGFSLTPLNKLAAVFPGAGFTDMIGNSDSSFLGWEESNVITLTRDSGVPFELVSVLLGPITIGGPPVSITLTAFFDAGGSDTMTFDSLNTATLAVVGWSNLTAVEFRTTDDSGMDNLVVPTPSAAAGLCVGGLVRIRRRR